MQFCMFWKRLSFRYVFMRVADETVHDLLVYVIIIRFEYILFIFFIKR